MRAPGRVVARPFPAGLDADDDGGARACDVAILIGFSGSRRVVVLIVEVVRTAMVMSDVLT